ncbi:MAG: precorrin-6y C5,15-methyltransferase (decarboxylating) subunit CbiE [Hyphomicrobiales bacterium]
MNRWLTLIGTPADGLAGLTSAARAALDEAEIIIVPKRLALEELPAGAEVHNWPSPLSAMMPRMKEWRGRNTVVLATGNPFHFGIGTMLSKNFSVEEMNVLPAPSAFSLAAARLGWSLQDVDMISLHGRPVSALAAFLQPGARILALTTDAQTVADAATLMTRKGFGPSAISVLQNMGADEERISDTTAGEFSGDGISDFNTLAIECVCEPGTALKARVPGLPDDAFVHDGQLTKREVRAATLAALGPVPGGLLWDVGGGCGSVGIEWMRAARGARAIAFEQNQKRIAMAGENALALGVPGLEIITGSAPGVLEGRAEADAVFIGGAVDDDGVFDACWAALKTGGRLVANAVTLEGQAALTRRIESHGGELVRIDVSYLDNVGARHVMRPRMSVMQYRVEKQ